MAIAEPNLTERRKHSLLTRILARLGRRYWVSRIDKVLSEAKQSGRLDNDCLHELDARMKYTPNLQFQQCLKYTPNPILRR